MSESITTETQLEPINTSQDHTNTKETFSKQETQAAQEAIKKTETNRKQELLEELKAISLGSKCPSHPEEDLQFYCFNSGKTLCAECLLKGGYTGSNVSNLRKAAETIKGKLSDLTSEMSKKLESCNSVQTEIKSYQAQIEETIENYKQQVNTKMNELRDAINLKENELFEKINAMREDRLQALLTSAGSLNGYQDEIQAVKDILENNIQDFNDLNLCQFYSEKLSTIKSQLSTEVGSKIQRVKKIVDRCQLQDQSSLSKFSETIQKIQLQFEALGSEIGRHRFETLASCVEANEDGTKERIKKASPTFAERIDTQKERNPKEITIPGGMSPLYPNPDHTSSFLAKSHYGDITSPLTTKSTFMVDMYRENFNRIDNNNFSSLRAPNIIDNYKGQIAKVSGARSPANIIPKKEINFNLNQPKASMASKINNSKLIDNVFSARTSRFPSAKQYTSLEGSIDQIEKMMTARVGTERSLSKYSKNNNNNLPKESSSSNGNFNFERKFIDAKSSKPVDTFAFKSQGSLRQRLTTLNSKLFN